MSSSVADPSSQQQQQQACKVHQLEVALAEITSLPPKRAVYEKRGTIFFRSTVAAATKSQQKELEKEKPRGKKRGL
jgi:chaperonin cofactor prefoldin